MHTWLLQTFGLKVSGEGESETALHHTNHLPKNGLFCSEILYVEEGNYFFPSVTFPAFTLNLYKVFGGQSSGRNLQDARGERINIQPEPHLEKSPANVLR